MEPGAWVAVATAVLTGIGGLATAVFSALRQKRQDIFAQYERTIERLQLELQEDQAERKALWTEMQKTQGKMVEVQMGAQRCHEDNLRMREQLGITAEEAREVHAQVVADTDGKITSVNSSVCIMFGYTHPEDLIGQNVELLIPTQYQQRHREEMKKAVAVGMPKYRKRTIHTWGLRKDGTEFAVSIDLEVIRQGEEWLFGATIRKRRETQLKP